MRTVRIFLGVLSAILAAALVASGPLLLTGVIHPLAHQRVAYVGAPIIIVYVVWSLVHEIRTRGKSAA